MGRHTPEFRARAGMEYAARFVISAVTIGIVRDFEKGLLYLLDWFLPS